MQVCKKVLTKRQMSDAAYIEQAAKWSRDLTTMRTRGPGDLSNAMRAVEREYGVDYWTQWRLRYRPKSIKEIGVGVYLKLRAAYESECARQMRKLADEIEVTRAIAGPDHPAVVEAETVVGKTKG